MAGREMKRCFRAYSTDRRLADERVHFFAVADPSDSLLAAGASGAGAVSHHLAAVIAVQDRGDCRRRRARAGEGDHPAAGTRASRPARSIAAIPPRWGRVRGPHRRDAEDAEKFQRRAFGSDARALTAPLASLRIQGKETQRERQRNLACRALTDSRITWPVMARVRGLILSSVSEAVCQLP